MVYNARRCRTAGSRFRPEFCSVFVIGTHSSSPLFINKVVQINLVHAISSHWSNPVWLNRTCPKSAFPRTFTVDQLCLEGPAISDWGQGRIRPDTDLSIKFLRNCVLIQRNTRTNTTMHYFGTSIRINSYTLNRCPPGHANLSSRRQPQLS